MPMHNSDLHIDVFGNGVRMFFNQRTSRKMRTAPFSDQVIRESGRVWLLAPIVDRDPKMVANQIAAWAEDVGLNVSF